MLTDNLQKSDGYDKSALKTSNMCISMQRKILSASTLDGLQQLIHSSPWPGNGIMGTNSSSATPIKIPSAPTTKAE
jgi:hypothetical protein